MPIGTSDWAYAGTIPANRASDAGAADDLSDPVAGCCPICGEIPDRIRRRAIDRALSLFVPVHRYRCINPLCGWEGNHRSRLETPPRPLHSGLASLMGQVRRWQVRTSR